MERLPKKPTTKNPRTMFTGDVWVDPIMSPQTNGQRASAATPTTSWSTSL